MDRLGHDRSNPGLDAPGSARSNRKPQGQASTRDWLDARAGENMWPAILAVDINAASQHFKNDGLRHSFAGLRSDDLCSGQVSFLSKPVSLVNGLFTTFGEWFAHRNPVLILFCVHGISSEGTDASQETISRTAVREIGAAPPGD
jgi:hypothetical protein